MAVTAEIVLQLKALQTGVNDLGTPAMDFLKLAQLVFADGSGQGQANKIWASKRTLGASATENLDLAGVLTDVFGSPITFTAIKGILVIAESANTNDVVVGGAGSNTFIGPFADATDKIKARPGGWVGFAHPGAGWTVTASTGDILLMANGGGTTGVTYTIIVLGV